MVRLDALTVAKATAALVLLAARRRRLARRLLLAWLLRSTYGLCRRGVFREAT